jgi:thiol-disulfide isomerase/thioredoxin
MKKIFTLVCFALSVNSFAQSKTATLSGKLIKSAGDSLVLDAGDHKPQKIAVNKNGVFKSTVKLDSGAYYTFTTGVLYLAPGMDLQITKPDSVYVYAGKGSVENNLFRQINEAIKPYLPFQYAALFDKMVDTPPADFIKEMESYKTSANKLLTDNNGLSPYFVKTQQLNIDYIARWATNAYMLKYGKDPAVEKEQRQFFAGLNAQNLKDNREKLLELANKVYAKRMEPQERLMLQKVIWGDFDVNSADLFKLSATYKTMLDQKISQMVSAEQQRTSYASGKSQDELKFDVLAKEINNEYIKQRLLYPLVRAALRPNAKDADVIYTKYAALATDAFYKNEVDGMYKRLKLYGKGGQTPLFVFDDVNGKQVALKDLLKGNYVYIDIWATWCGPCVAEIPSLKKMEALYHDKPIKFVSISIDAQKDKDKWKKFVKDRELGGVQVYAGTGSEFVKNYNVPFIPRFILIAPDGKIVSEDAERPSNPKLQAQLDELLK